MPLSTGSRLPPGNRGYNPHPPPTVQVARGRFIKGARGIKGIKVWDETEGFGARKSPCVAPILRRRYTAILLHIRYTLVQHQQKRTHGDLP